MDQAGVTRALADGAAVIVSTHRLDIAELVDRYFALRDGRVIHDGAADRTTLDRLLP